ncbi:hypothetical protein KIW84_056892 [Lathyrus oleraceus]|uniref:phosphoglycerate kinase n=1 Tax=Pisum sativum TaxID=3888 RepID=A0A9D4X1S9_PEA|nr:hypothetical protein KIW84_056892 [Pisum sativum]
MSLLAAFGGDTVKIFDASDKLFDSSVIPAILVPLASLLLLDFKSIKPNGITQITVSESATNRGVLVVSPAGNEGILSSATNLAPWMLIVAVSSTDRDFTTVIMLENGAKVTGESLSLFEMNTSSRIISALQAFAGYFTPYQSIEAREINVEALEGLVARSPNLKSLSGADVLSAMDDAIHDGVDILSLSLGPNPPQPNYFEDAVSVGAFHVFQKGILVSAFAGNSVFPRTACNVAPWTLTVAASTLDGEFSSNIYLGNSKVLKGFSLNPIKMEYSHGDTWKFSRNIEILQRPFAAIVGGSKVSSKIGVIESLLEKVDMLLLGGGMIFTFHEAKSLLVGSSLVEEDKLDLATTLLKPRQMGCRSCYR